MSDLLWGYVTLRCVVFFLFLMNRYLVPAELTVGQFVYMIRKRIKIPDEKTIFMFVNDTLPPTG